MTEATRRAHLWPARWATYALFLGNGLGIGAWAAAIPGLKARLPLTDVQLSLVLLAFAVGAIISMPLAGFFVARTGTRKACFWAALAFALALFLPPCAASLSGLMGVALLLGLSNGALDVSMNAHAGQLEQKWSGAIMSSFHAVFSFGGLLGAALGALFSSLSGRDASSLVLWIPALLACGLALCARPFLGDDVAPAKRAPMAWSIPSRVTLLLGAIALLCMLVEGAMADWSGVYLASIGDATRAAAGYGAFSLTMMIGRLTGDRAVNVFGRTKIIQLGGVLSLVGLMIAALAPNEFWAIPGFALVGLGLANVVPSVFSAAARLGQNAAAGVAMVATAGYTGFLAGPPMIGMVASMSGLRSAMGLLAVASGLVVVLALFTLNRPDSKA